MPEESEFDRMRRVQAEVVLREAYDAYLQWQPDGDWDTFLSWVDDEGGQRPTCGRTSG